MTVFYKVFISKLKKLVVVIIMKIKQIYLVLSSALLASTWLSTLSCQARKINKDNNTNSNKALQDPENKNPNNSQMIVLPNKVLKW
ncbi:Uncharacterised protein, partial [Mycoplasma putrefaciens]